MQKVFLFVFVLPVCRTVSVRVLHNDMKVFLFFFCHQVAPRPQPVTGYNRFYQERFRGKEGEEQQQVYLILQPYLLDCFGLPDTCTAGCDDREPREAAQSYAFFSLLIHHYVFVWC